jgi:hypothetical protein
MRLQIWLRTVILLRAGFLTFDFIPAQWQGSMKITSPFSLQPMGWLCLHKYHPKAGMWISLQRFNQERVDFFFNYLNENHPDWLTGIVNGPSSPSINVERERLPDKYMLRSYPDLTHTVRCQHPVKHWDQAFALTEGRECTNPQPRYYAEIHNRDAPLTDGFISYSDGIHDDVNKVTWSQMGWDTNQNVRNIVIEYCNFFFGSSIANEAADGILALDQNWEGPALGNSIIGNTLKVWKKLETENPVLGGNWRWQQLVMRAYYDAYIQQRLEYGKGLENKVYERIASANTIGALNTIIEANSILRRAKTEPIAREQKLKAIYYLDALNKSVGLQSSVKLHHAAGAERGALRDFIDYPLNNRWWLQDEFAKIQNLSSEAEKISRLDFIRTYENPGEGSFYDNVSSTDAIHVISETDGAIDFLWENNGRSRKRLSTQLFQFSPVLQYDELNPNTNYLIRIAGYGEALLRANGERLTPTKYQKGFEQFKEFPLPKKLIKNGKLRITFDKPKEEHLNWRHQSRVTDVWILKGPQF